MEPAACEVVVGSLPRSEEIPARPPHLRLPRTSLSRAPSAASPLLLAVSADRFRPPMPTSGDPDQMATQPMGDCEIFERHLALVGSCT